MVSRSAALIVVSLFLFPVARAQGAAKPPVEVKTDTTWTGEVTVDTAVRVARGTLKIVPAYPQRDAPLNPADVVVSPEVKFPFSDEDMIARKHTVSEVLDAYRNAYAPKPGSPAINAGDPAGKMDLDVTDGKPDIGAIEVAAK